MRKVKKENNMVNKSLLEIFVINEGGGFQQQMSWTHCNQKISNDDLIEYNLLIAFVSLSLSSITP